MFVDKLLLVSKTALRTTKKKFNLGRHRIELCLFLQLAGFTLKQPSVILALQYKHLVVTILRDPAGGPYQLLLEFTFEYTKEYLGMKDAIFLPLLALLNGPHMDFIRDNANKVSSSIT
jgi:Protein of unknown function (DUF3435)